MNKLKGKKVILIGGSGFIGSHLAKRLAELDADITIFCKNPGRIKKLPFQNANKIKAIRGDVANYDSVKDSIKNQDVIINLAAIVQDNAGFEPYADIETNCKGQINILEARKRFNPKSIYIFLGSRAQFGKVEEKDLPVSEEHCQAPISLYGIHKQTAENYCKLYKRAFNLKSIIIRLPQVYGTSLTKEETDRIIDKIVKKAVKNEEFLVNGYGRDIKDLIYIDDLTDLLIKILNSDIEDGIFNAGSGEKIKLIDIAKKVIALSNSGSFRIVRFPESIAKFELGSLYFDISKVKRAFKWEPKTTIDIGLKKMINFYKLKTK